MFLLVLIGWFMKFLRVGRLPSSLVLESCHLLVGKSPLSLHLSSVASGVILPTTAKAQGGCEQ